MLRFRLVAAVLALVGCGGGDGDDDGSAGFDATPASIDLGGWYQVTSMMEGACTATEATSTPPSHIWMEPFSGIFYLRYCSGAAEADCFATPFYDFITPIDDGWSAEGGGAFFSGGCTLNVERTSAVLSGGELHVQSLDYLDNRDVAQEQCTLAAALALTEPCVFRTELVATRL